MKNYDVARVFERMPDLMEIKGDNPFKIKAYRRVAEIIDGLAENIEEVARRGALLEIPGVGQGIAAKIDEILDTGTTKLHEKLKSEIPDGVLLMLAIPNIGPRKAKLLYESLGVEDIDQLEQAALDGRIRVLPRMGEKTEQNILRGIEAYRRMTARRHIGIVLPYAETIVKLLKESGDVDRIELAGSLRRRRDTIGDIDIIATSRNPKGIISIFTGLPFVNQVLEMGETRAAVMSNLDLRVDLRIVEPENFGSLLQHFTGSVAHNIKLRTLATSRGLKLNEYGVFDTGSGEKIPLGENEEEIYNYLGLEWMPPEIREDRGEIEAAQTGKLPKLVDISDIRGEFHVHTKASDGGNTIEEMAYAAMERNYQYIAICDHSKGLAVAHGLSEEQILEQMARIRALNEEFEDFRILTGTEVDIKSDGSLDFPDYILEKLDVVVASVHSRFSMPVEQMTERVINAIKSPHVDIIGHPTGRVLGYRDPYEIDMDRVIEAAAKYGTALEINASPDRLDINDIYTKHAKEAGVKIAINCDAHNPFNFDFLRYGVWQGRRGWLERDDVLNAIPVDELLEYLREKSAAKMSR